MPSADGRAEMPQIVIDDGKPVVQKRERVLVKLSAPLDLDAAGSRSARVEVTHKRLSPPFSILIANVAAICQQAYVQCLAA